ncbi:diguanylate cyclase [Jatrophihabitans endophyticus]|uniref:GGDEF domain-containing protein n=1 Tax=Jatrophihabitans endophyticus TaxID=1206085 RepID=UPI0019DE1A30|nr:diguanylate cyclase [Jatrophihabitans endophyticus]MBE7188570.1 diguanylate cyclase [Jatrophihabitans endophyticus]
MPVAPSLSRPRTWQLWRNPARFLALVLGVDLVTLVWVADEITRPAGDRRDWLVALLLLAVAVVFEEGATHVARLKWRLSSQLKRDMTSVWSVAAAVALPPVPGVTLVVIIYVHLWWRQQRPGGQPAHRAVYVGATVVLACLTAGYAVRAVDGAWTGLPWALASSIAVLIAIVIGTTLNRALVTAALMSLGNHGRSLLGTLDDNLTELSTLCLGGLVAIAAIHEPWLCALAVLPMAMLQRGSFVRELETAAVTDPKTGLINAVGWEHIAQRELGRARRENYGLSVLIADIDHFKLVNDRHGHLVGDQVLRGLARALGGALREYDSVGRFGGEEFVAVLPETDVPAAIEIAERIRARVNTLSVGSVSSVADERLLSVSIGVATVSAGDLADTELTAMLISADRALYRAKEAGRNRVCLADPDAPAPVVPA